MTLGVAACGSSSDSAATPAASSSAAPAASSSSSAAATSADSSSAAPAETSSSAAESAAPAGDAVNLTFSTWVPGMDKVVDLWNAKNPKIQVKVSITPNGGSGTYQNFLNGVKAGTAPDLGQIEYDSLANFRVQDALEDISAVPGVKEAKDSFIPWTWGQVDFAGSGGVYAIPQDAGPMAMFYRKDIFDGLGLKPPTTWAEYAEAAAKINAADPTHYITHFSQGDPNWYTGLLWQAGAKLFDNSGDGVKVNLDSDPKAAEVNSYWQDLISKKLVATNLQGFSPELYKAWDDGSIATWISAAWGYSTIRDNAPAGAGKWAVAPMPQWTAGGNAAGNWGGSSTAVLKGSKHVAEAAQFAIWLNTDPEALTMGNKLGGLYPAAVAGAELPALKEGVAFYGDQKIFDVFNEASKGVDASFQWGPTMTDTYNAIKDGVAATLGGTSTLADAFKLAQEKTVASLEAQAIPVVK
ncbi:extracellular solute-binding protein [Nakamurella antarctica]|uniref:Extracellular solute-binding protein n=2 Tax=Nakamurella antarctica TaxID=1902245 RepID=A0A3G8ZPM7_9ACTN|nr:extracellular solute-binding protein [Nakamurella antarctica]